ncbi:transporter substrate-binding domain-containing protein [Microbacterium oleivorans]|uniref:Transporter substrate-binding domain-containing protein n=1 Tax=Microbacterium oleivorans TaxID=273677 RepID=A0A7D5IXV8_9MICO|nr:transporter substrate-binding domain-containing protein [Microbacterium oleivorans]QLD13082.1 transporter substrate-binding domain-containing protein [Microbacterium oleivorans]
MNRRPFRPVPRLGLLVGASLTSVALLAGCASSGEASPAAGESELFDQAIADLLPADIAEAGEIHVASGPGYPPILDLAEDGVTLSGSQPEEVRLIGEVLGIDIVFDDIKFDALFPALESGKVDMAAASLGITQERLGAVDFVSDFQGGTTLLVAGGNPEDLSIETLCGHAVGVLKGSTEETITLPVWAEACSAAGDSDIEISTFATAADAVLALSSGRVEATVSALPPAVYQAAQSDGAMEALDINHEPTPWGLAFPKGSELTEAVAAALQKLMDEGLYLENLERFGVEVGAVDTAEVYTDPSQAAK